MSKHWKRPVRVMFQGRTGPGKYKGTPAVSHGGLGGHKNKSTAEPTHSLFHHDITRSVFSGTMDECYDNLARRRPGESVDYLMLDGWTIKRIDEPTVKDVPETEDTACARCEDRGCADCGDPASARAKAEFVSVQASVTARQATQPAGAPQTCSRTSEGESDDHGHESSL